MCRNLRECSRRKARRAARLLFRCSTVDGNRVEQFGEHLRPDADQKAAAATVDIDQRENQDRSFHENGECFAQAKGRSAADLITAVTLRPLRLAGLHALGADLTSQSFQADLLVTVHQDDQWIRVLILHDQSFNHRVLGNTQLPRGFGGAAMLNVIVKVFGEGDGVLT